MFPKELFTPAANHWAQVLHDAVTAHMRAQNRLLDLACEAALLYGAGVRVRTRGGIWTSIEVTVEVESGTIQYQAEA
jgi:hypothetical protein